MKRKKTFSTMEIVLLSFLVGYLIVSFLQARKAEQEEHGSSRKWVK
ncbi:MAG TPA: hypothetical protein VF458_10810 [Ktedonobacteraceae bacterium]